FRGGRGSGRRAARRARQQTAVRRRRRSVSVAAPCKWPPRNLHPTRMRKHVANLVYPLLREGLNLKDWVRFGKFNLDQQQAKLKKLIHAVQGGGRGPDAGDVYLGMGYPLACWLDEIFILDPQSPWRDEWNEKKIEAALYGSNERAAKFWEQTGHAEAR